MRTFIPMRAAAASAVVTIFFSLGLQAALAQRASIVQVAGHARRLRP